MKKKEDAAASEAKLEMQRREFTAAATDAQRKLEERKGAAMKDQEALLKRAVADARAEMERLRKQARADDGQKIEPAPEALQPPQITGGLGALQGGNPLIVGGTSFGSQPGKVHLMAATGSLQLEINEWHPGGIGGYVPAAADTLCLTGEVQVERQDGKKSNIRVFSVPVIYKSLAQQDVAIVRCSDDGNYNHCNGISPGSDSCGPGMHPGEGEFTARTPSAQTATIAGDHQNCIGAVGDDSGVDIYEINLKNGWVLDSAGFVSTVPAGEGWTQPSSGHLPGGFEDGTASWKPEIAWMVTPADIVRYAVYVLIRGPQCTSHK